MSPFGVIPKSGKPGKWRLINDLSSPEGSSINDGIEPPLCSIKYASLDTAASLVRAAGPGALLAKLDLRHAYRVVPVHPADRLLLGMSWDGQVFIDTALPFGLRSAPKIFSAVADALLWVMFCKGASSGIHYLDDYLFIGPCESGSCGRDLALALEVCDELGMPVALEKLEGPEPVLVFLGIEMDSIGMQLRLPLPKLRSLKVMVASWLSRTSATKRELLSLIGHLQHAAGVVKPGRTFLRHLIDLAASVRPLHHRVHIRESTRADMQWWNLFLERWNGCSMIPPQGPPTHIFASDASGGWGCGAVWGCDWFQLQWPGAWSLVNIAVKELVPIVAAVALWGKHWRGSRVRALCDNMAVVAGINLGRVRDKKVMHLLRCLHFYCAEFGVSLTASHLPGSRNQAADAISRNRLNAFFTLVPQAPRSPSVVPDALGRILLATPVSWTSPLWRRQFRTSLGEVLLHQPPDHTAPGPSATGNSAPS